MKDQPKLPCPWPLDALDGTKMILRVCEAILSGPTEDWYVERTPEKDTPEIEAVQINVVELIKEAEGIVKAALIRSSENCKAGPMGQFFEQQTGPGLPPVKP